MRTVSLNNNEIIFNFTYYKNIIENLKSLEARYNPNNKTWILPNDSFLYIDIEKIIKKHSFTINHSLAKIKRFNKLLFSDEVSAQVNDYLSKYTIKNDEKQQYNKLYKFTPRDYQWTAIIWMLVEEKVINGDDTGLGKSIETLGAVEIGELYPCLIICPNSVKYNWAKYINKWMYRSYSVIEGKKSDDYTKDFTIINFDKLGKKVGKRVKISELLNRDWGSVVVDESQMVKNSKAIRSKATKQVCKLSPYNFLLTGTLATNKPIDIFNQLAIIEKEHVVGGWKKFVYDFCGAHKTPFGIDTSGATNLVELNRKLRTTCYLRREKSEVLKDLPEKQTTVLDIEISNRKEYEKAQETFVQYLLDNYSKKEALKKLKAEIVVKMGMLLRLSAVGKLNNIFEWIDNFLESGRKLVVFANTNKVIEEICSKYNCNRITGDISAKKRQEYIDDFVQNEEIRMIALNIKAGGTGIDSLQEVCSDALFAEWPETPALMEQAEARVFRSGQENHVNIYQTLAKDTIEEYKYEDLMNKKLITDAINKGKSIDKEPSVVEDLIKYFKK